MPLHGVCTIALTPFTEEGDLDEESIESLSDFYVDSGVHGVTVLDLPEQWGELTDPTRLRLHLEGLPTEDHTVPLTGIQRWFFARAFRASKDWSPVEIKLDRLRPYFLDAGTPLDLSRALAIRVVTAAGRRGRFHFELDDISFAAPGRGSAGDGGG